MITLSSFPRHLPAFFKRWGTVFLLCLTIGLSGCGFKLRAPVELAFKKVAVLGYPFDQVVRELKLTLRESDHIDVVDSIDQADAVIDILETVRDDEIVSVSALGRAQDYEYILAVRYRICGPKAKDCDAADTLEIRRDMTYSESQILAKQNEEQFLWRNMSKEMVRLILLRLGSFKPLPVPPELSNSSENTPKTQFEIDAENERARISAAKKARALVPPDGVPQPDDVSESNQKNNDER